MKPHDNTDPWSQGQKQVHYSAPGWLSKLTLVVTVPFRLVFGVIGLFIGGARALDGALIAKDPEPTERFIGDAQYNQDVGIYGESEAMDRVLHETEY